MEVVILKARAQLNRLVSSSGERRGDSAGSGASGGRGPRAHGAGAGGVAARTRTRTTMAPAVPAPAAPWLNATLLYNATRLNATFDTDYELLSANSTDEHNNHWFCAKWTNAQQDLFQVMFVMRGELS